MPGSVILAGARTPIGKLSGSLAGFSGSDLGGLAIKAALERAGVAGDKVEQIGQLRVGVHLEGLWLGVEVVFARGKQHVAPGCLQLGAVGIPGAGVAVKVFVGQELQAVHKDAGHRHIAQGLGLAHQADVAFVQVAHGGHKGGAAAGEGGAQFGNGVGDEHFGMSG